MQQQIKTFTNETIIYDDAKHAYYSLDGKKLQGASSYAKKFTKPFPKESIISSLSKTWDMPAKDIDHLWSLNGEISNNYGTAIHTALELWFRYHKKGKVIADLKGLEHNYALPKNVYLRDIVLSFVESFGTLDVTPEATLSCVAKGMAGRTDAIIHIADKVCRVGDWKTNNEMSDDKLLGYQHQLSYYADMLTSAGWTVEGLDIYYHDGDKWAHIPLEVLPVELPRVTDDISLIEISTARRLPPAFKGV